ncbi:MAG TPA: glycosyltransferase family 39 protein [Acidimicrobiales bacterium]|nr:glycosyltransferase family 39 protein [Acidimicrobiales bacterium]
MTDTATGDDDGSNDQAWRARAGRRWFELSLGVVAFVAFAIPAYYTASVRAHQTFWGDPRFFYYWPATQVAQGRGFLDVLTMQFGQPVPSASHPPGFITLLAGFYKLGFQSPQAMRYLLCIMSAATVVVVGLLVARVIGRRAGLIAAGIAAIYPNIWISSTLVMSETLFLFGLSLGLLGFYAFFERPRSRSVAVASIGLTLAASARPEILVLFAVMIVPVIFSRRRSLATPQQFRLVVLAAVFPLLVFAPWFVYNLNRFERPVLVSTGFGQTMLTGACDSVFYGERIGYWSVNCTANSHPPEPAEGDVPDQSVLDAYYRKRAIRYYSYHKSQVPLVVAARIGRMFGVYQPKQQNFADRYVDKRGSYDLVRASQFSFWVLGLLSIPGLILWRRRKIAIYPLVGIFAIAVVVEALTFGNTRYRVGVDLCAVLLAATAIDWAIGRFTRRHRASPAEDEPVDTISDDVVATSS